MSLNVYPIILDPNTASTRVFDPLNDILVINQLSTSDNDVATIKHLNDIRGLIYLNSSDSTLGYLEDKVDSTFFESDNTNFVLTLKNDSITASKIANDVDVSSKGFNADLVDGYHGSELAKLDENNSFSGLNTFISSVVFKDNVEIQGETYTNYADTLNFHGNIIALNYDQGSDVPTLSGIRILRGSTLNPYFIGFDHQNTVFKVINEDSGNYIRFKVGDPTELEDAATKKYVDEAISSANISNYLRTDGLNSMEADIDLDGHRLVNVGDPVDDDDVVTKGYFDDNISSMGYGNTSEEVPESPSSNSIEICDIPKETFVVNIALTISDVYDNSEISGIQIGDQTHDASLMTVSDNDPFTKPDTFISWPYKYFNSPDKVILKFVGGVPTTGKAHVYVSFSK